jgi:hypothetical protein
MKSDELLYFVYGHFSVFQILAIIIGFVEYKKFRNVVVVDVHTVEGNPIHRFIMTDG